MKKKSQEPQMDAKAWFRILRWPALGLLFVLVIGALLITMNREVPDVSEQDEDTVNFKNYHPQETQSNSVPEVYTAYANASSLESALSPMGVLIGDWIPLLLGFTIGVFSKLNRMFR